ncbi:MAG: hypothetical protein M1812_003070 [Candelaria pacifica]|nr:MAG: hypothetical protein M1812_003070 [Candelaria pacifica]
MASEFLPKLYREWPDLIEEMKGLAQGSGVEFLAIVALNVRTEIAYGTLSDGCTALSWNVGGMNILAQNWDWQREQDENLISLFIRQEGKPTIHMITEAGIIGKIGLNSAGVGVCLNAIRAPGVDYVRLPVHLALRVALETSSKLEAVRTLEQAGIASACNIIVADVIGGTGLECSSSDIVTMPMVDGKVAHTNHFLFQHGEIKDKLELLDSPFRLERIQELIAEVERSNTSVGYSTILEILSDEKNLPAAISRAETEDSSIATLFSITMDLRNKMALVRFGRPSTSKKTLVLDPCKDTRVSIHGENSKLTMQLERLN